MKRTTQITIDDRTYSVTQYMGIYGQELFFKLGQIFGDSILSFFNEAKKADSFLDIDIDQSLRGIFLKIDPRIAIQLEQDILSGTMIHDGNQIRDLNFNLDFAGRNLHLFKLLYKVLAFQYSDFLEGLAFLGLGKAKLTPQ